MRLSPIQFCMQLGVASSALSHGLTLSATDRGDAVARTFELTVNFFPSKAKLVDGSIQNIERDTIVKWEVEFTEIDPQVLQNMGEEEMGGKNWGEYCLGSRARSITVAV